MKKSFLILLISIFTFSFYSCRETTEANTDGNMEESEVIEESEDEIE